MHSRREIAEALFAYTKTVEARLTRAYEKLGIHRPDRAGPDLVANPLGASSPRHARS